MKNAKKLMMMLALSLTVVVMSCDEKLNEDTMPQETPEQTANGASRLKQVGTETFDTSGMDDWTEVATTDLPQAAQDYLNANYEGIEIAEGYKTVTGEFVLLMDNDMVIIFNADGAVILEFDLEALLDGYDDDNDDDDDEEWDEIPLDSLPQSVLDYVAANYPNSTIEEAVSCPDNGHIIVFLDTDEALEFDADGNFVGLLDEDDWDDEDDWEDDFEEVALDSLPQAIKDHMAANYAAATAEEAWFDTTEELYYVLLDTDVLLVYDKDGNFVEELDEDDWDDEDEEDEDFEEVKIEDLPQAIKDYLATNYADNTIEGAYWDATEELYYIELDGDLYVVFDKDGNFKEEFVDD